MNRGGGRPEDFDGLDDPGLDQFEEVDLPDYEGSGWSLRHRIEDEEGYW